MFLRAAFVTFACLSWGFVAHAEEPTETLEIKSGQKIALVGNCLAERMNLFGHFETRLQLRFAEQKPVFRNFGWPADAVEQQARPGNYTKIDDPFLVYSPDLLICFFGFNESFAGSGEEESRQFYKNYEQYLARTARTLTEAGGKEPRFALVSPIAFEDGNDAFGPKSDEINDNLRTYTELIRELATEKGLPFVDLFTPTLELFNEDKGHQYTINGCHLNESGDNFVAWYLDLGLFGGQKNPDADKLFDMPLANRIRRVVNDKSWLHLQDYRMLNGWYVYGGRRTWDTETFPTEFRKIRSMVDVRDQFINDLASGKEVSGQPDDSKTGEVFIPETMFGSRDDDFRRDREPKTLQYPTPEEAIDQMTVPEGFQVELFASEREFPELANPTQIAFDSKGRLWVSCMINYPHTAGSIIHSGSPTPAVPAIDC